MSELYNRILDYSRQNQLGELSPWFQKKLQEYIEQKYFFPEIKDLLNMSNQVIDSLANYAKQCKLQHVVVGISGGIDSALTATFFQRARWKVHPFLLPIHQNPEETERGLRICEFLKIEPILIDLTTQYDSFVSSIDGLSQDDSHTAKLRKGNIRARLRMITLYDRARSFGGIVASTDNFTEKCAGFWTIMGDEGDLGPIQNFNKSWEVPALSHLLWIPEELYKATPTDGLGITKSDENQFGCTYLEFDIMLAAIFKKDLENLDERAKKVLVLVRDRLKNTWYKRARPVNLPHPLEKRSDWLKNFDIENMNDFIKTLM